ncbi:unnamed protein product [Linum trigynum]|uniref:Uncharacterized protein n=1 Tax=Linum trigynum TaxID=586398 RepID=A0AAV2FCX4_9ROSI
MVGKKNVMLSVVIMMMIMFGSWEEATAAVSFHDCWIKCTDGCNDDGPCIDWCYFTCAMTTAPPPPQHHKSTPPATHS